MTHAPSPTWEGPYRHDRRKHRHRCRCCHVVLNEGDPAIMARVAHLKTLAIHAACGDKQHGDAAWTWRDAMAFWGTQHLIAVGWKLPLPPVPGREPVPAGP
jgi:hypothetical protein